VVVRRQPAPPGLNTFLSRTRPPSWPSLHRAHSRLPVKDLYASDHVAQRQGERLRWMLSTCLAALVGATAILVVIYGATDTKQGDEGLSPALKRISEDVSQPVNIDIKVRPEGLQWATPRTDKLQITTGAMSMRFTIHETRRQKRAGREYIYAKPYYRIVTRLAPVPASYSDVIPPFNPFKLFANTKPIGSGEEEGAAMDGRSDVAVKVVELLGGILPEEDGQELETPEVTELVERVASASSESESMNGEGQYADGPFAAGRFGQLPIEESNKNTSVLTKSTFDAEDVQEATEGGKLTTLKVGPGDTLTKLLVSAGAENWQARTMIEAAAKIFPEAELAPGQQLDVTLVPSLTQQDKMEPVRFSVYSLSEGVREHKVTVTRDSAGEFIASAAELKPIADSKNSSGEGDRGAASSVYSSIYYAGLLHHMQPDAIMQILKVHAYETDFRRRIRAGDQIELFFDPKDESAEDDDSPGEILYTAITVGAETRRFYRYRTADGITDFYDAQGNNSKKFLMRRPVRGDDVRLTSGYGVRFHPLLNDRKMHTGVDWAAPTGTPILAAGNGVIEEAGRKGQYGNYVRIRHANGYQTAYGHMSRIASGAVEGVKVRQGQVIGFVGSTGLSSGPHLHFEVLVNTRFVDPMSIQVPQERQLSGKELQDFQKERARIDDLMRRAPVKTETVASR
jgi:murein DD-endopeptidase MepM/ murein hydrolase activator NlpD